MQDNYEYIKSIVAVVVGYLLSQTTEFIKTQNKNNKIKKTVRILTKIEIKKNQSLLSAYWNEIKKEIDVNDKDRISKIGHKLINNPLPKFSKHVWESQIDKISEYFDPPAISKLWTVNDSFLQIRSLYEKINQIYNESHKEISETRMNTNLKSRIFSTLTFNKKAKEQIIKFEEIVNHISLKYISEI